MSDTFFGVQLAMELPAFHELRPQLANSVREMRSCTNIPEQRPRWTHATGLLRTAIPYARLGTWDLIRSNAVGEYEDWASGLEAMAGWSADDFGSNGSYVLATIIMLVSGGSNADLTLGNICDLPESQWHSAATYDRLVAAPPQLNFTNVLGSGFYLAPHPEHAGFSREVLTGEGFEYLETIRS